MPKKPKHILVIRLSAMGDVAMTVPVLNAFTKQYPDVKLTVLTRAFFAPLFQNIKNVNVYSAEVKGKHKGVTGLYKLSKELKRLDIDVVADLHNVLRSNILKQFLFNLPFKKIDKGRSEKKSLVTGKIFKQLKTTHQRYADVFGALGFPIDLSEPIFRPAEELSDSVREIVGEKDGKWIGIAPFAAHEGKMYPLDLMEEVIATLSKTYKLFLFGGGIEEAKTLSAIEERHQNVKNLAGKFTFEEELQLISHLDLMLSMDSGNGHLAAIFGVKVITLWGVTHPYAGFAPFHQDKNNALLSDRTQYPLIPTSVYGNKAPEGYKEAMRSIAPEEVVRKVGLSIKEGV
ncbi:glycosyltransferase family 9 protein [Galbibacter sp. EGI 63066]|uniref:glycosyltransferase family 9 protein n=1 Tax=Galbibacter sp. EGI 63066 TaxID=2993559 RepID=UPI002248E14F|nr:glycosyltransferase family 9 protein [Galbibacter sp. EGI 63066]MCX2679110.1 glycosyltransferase family 9 protein [Galbibacter sp. EGI 63066]